MMDELPVGTIIGEMQAPLQWIFSRTTRFSGVVRITMQDGKGFVLLQKGTPLAAQFTHPLKSLDGPPALKYFSSQPLLDFGLFRYEPREMQEALAVSATTQALLQPGNDSPPAGHPVEQEDVVGSGDTMPPAPPPDEEPDLFEALLRHPGVTGVACFADGLCTSSAGKIDTEYTAAFAEDLLRWVLRLRSTVPSNGEFVQMTLFYRGGNIVIASYGSEYLCIFTRPEVQLGQIRRLIRDLQDEA